MKKIRYAVVGLGWIAQESVLPAFAHAKKNSELAALVSNDREKLEKLGKKYKVTHLYSYDEYDGCLKSGHIDAVYIALPNNMHHEYTIRAAKAGIHILCEKPMAMNSNECQEMIEEAKNNNVKLMIAYRLHFEEGNLKAVEMAKSGKLGEVRFFNSTFSTPVTKENIRLEGELSGGTLYDVGIYCINAARSVFQSEPIEVMALSIKGNKKRFEEVDEMTSATLLFPDNRLATFISSFGASSASAYDVLGTKGHLHVDPAFHHSSEVKHTLEIDKKKKKKTFPARDQFAPELIYFSNCILHNKEPEPSGKEGLADVRVIEGLYQSAKEKKALRLKEFKKTKKVSPQQEIKRPKAKKPDLVKAASPH
jgi:predicted dehydrogenase